MAEFKGIPLRGAPLPMQTVPAREEASPEVRRAAEQFESMFLSEMLAPMFEGIQTDGLGGVGLADSIIRELNRMQAAEQRAATPETDDGADR
jgi:Rod binding domain-containing protein